MYTQKQSKIGIFKKKEVKWNLAISQVKVKGGREMGRNFMWTIYKIITARVKQWHLPFITWGQRRAQRWSGNLVRREFFWRGTDSTSQAFIRGCWPVRGYSRLHITVFDAVLWSWAIICNNAAPYFFSPHFSGQCPLVSPLKTIQRSCSFSSKENTCPAQKIKK
jgi:hypothetical protein